MRALLLWVLLFLSGVCSTYGQQKEDAKESSVLNEAHDFDFIENKGQWNPAIRFKADIPSGAFFLTDEGFVYSFYHQVDFRDFVNAHESDQGGRDEVVRFHSYRVSFVGANSAKHFDGMDRRNYYHNYFLGSDTTTWAGHVPLFGGITQTAIYPGIDLKLYSHKGGMKYDFIVKPKADPKLIRMQFEGVQPTLGDDGSLMIATSVNQVIEKAPYCYQIIDGIEVPVVSEYALDGAVLSFSFPMGYDETRELIIDPSVIFATYSGATGPAAFSYATTFDKDGNLYAGAASFGVGWPTTIGAFQSVYGGGTTDVGVNKYSKDGTTLLHSTYYGGADEDYPCAMVVNDLGELIVVGYTSSTNLPVTTGCYNSTINGGRDIFVAHFNAAGSALIGATYIGTSMDEPHTYTMDGSTSNLNFRNTMSPLEVNLDAQGNIWCVANTPSASFPTTPNAAQATAAGGLEGVVFQFDPSCSNLLYSTYLGGTRSDAVFDIAFNSSGNVVVCGVTESVNFPTTLGALHPTAFARGGLDGFVSIIDPTTGALIASTLLGTDKADQVVNVQIDQYDNIYVLGRTMGDYPISQNVYAVPDGDVFIHKLNPNLTSSLLSTRLGTSQKSTIRYFPTAFLLDKCDIIYVAGLGSTIIGSGPNSSNLPPGMPLTSNAFSRRVDNLWFGALSPDFSDLIFGSYYGSPEDDHTHTGINRFDPDGVIYHSICSNSGSFPVTPGAFAPTKTISGQDIVSFKFDFNLANVRAAAALPSPQKDSVCAPHTIKFENNSTSPYSMEFLWDFGDGNTSTQTEPSHTFSTPGVYEVVLRARSDSSCNKIDFDTVKITVFEVTAPIVVSNDTTICSVRDSVELSIDIQNPNPNQVVEWGPSNGLLSSASGPRVIVDPAIQDRYYFVVTDSISGICGSSISDTIKLSYVPALLEIFTGDTSVCEGDSILIRAKASPQRTVVWSPGGDLSDSTILEPYLRVKRSGAYTLTASYPGCPDTSQSIKIDMESLPQINVPTAESCAPDSADISVEVVPKRSDYKYLWWPSTYLRDDFSKDNRFLAPPGEHNLSLQVTSPSGCAAKETTTVTIHPPINLRVSPTDTVIEYGSSFMPQVNGEGRIWGWSPPEYVDDPSSKMPRLSPESDVEFFVFVVDTNGCTDSASIKVRIKYGTNLRLPSAFSPNGDGLNDVFKFENVKFEQLKVLKIFNRYGQTVFQTNDIREGWDGTYKGVPASIGVYYYHGIVMLPNGAIEEYRGDVTLLR